MRRRVPSGRTGNVFERSILAFRPSVTRNHRLIVVCWASAWRASIADRRVVDSPWWMNGSLEAWSDGAANEDAGGAVDPSALDLLGRQVGACCPPASRRGSTPASADRSRPPAPVQLGEAEVVFSARSTDRTLIAASRPQGILETRERRALSAPGAPGLSR